MPTAAIALSSVRKVYGDGPAATVALDGVDLAIAAGRFVSLIGPSGCGKSTLLRLVAGLEPADRGTVAVHGVTPDEACAAKLIGFVPQAPALLPWLSVLRNVTLPQKINRGAARQRARIEGLAARDSGPPDCCARWVSATRWRSSRPSCPGACGSGRPSSGPSACGPTCC